MIAFQNNRKSLSELKRPEIDQQLDVKSRVGVLEGIVEFQEKINPLNVALADNLYSEISVIESRLLQVVEQNQRNAAAELEELKRHYNHRFDLQIADNLRNVQHISSLKSENTQLRKRLDVTIKKLKQLQTEFDGGESVDADSSAADETPCHSPHQTYAFASQRGASA